MHAWVKSRVNTINARCELYAGTGTTSKDVPSGGTGSQKEGPDAGEPGECPICLMFKEGGCKKQFDVSLGQMMCSCSIGNTSDLASSCQCTQ